MIGTARWSTRSVAVAQRGSGMGSVLGGVRADRRLAVVAVGSGASHLGAQLTLIGFTAELAGSGPFAVAGLFVAAAFGAALGTPLAGWAVDRFANRMVLAVAVCAQVVLLVGLLFAHPWPPALYPLVALVSACAGVARTCASTLTVGDGGRRLSSAQNTGSVAGIVLGGVLAAGPGIEVALMLDAVVTFAHLVMVVWLGVDRDPDRDDGVTAVPGGQWSGWVLLRSDQLLLGRVVAQAVAGVAVAIALVNEVFLVLGPIGGNGFTYSAVLVCWTAGLLIGPRLAPRATGPRALVAASSAAGLVLALALAAPALAPTLPVNAAAWLVAGACGSVLSTTLTGLVELRAPEPVRDRVAATVNAITVGSGTVAIVVAGVVVGAAGPLAAPAVASGFAAVACLMAALAVLRRDHLRGSVVAPDFEPAHEHAARL
ncbi:MFS transporter [Saccharothrix sp. HUAS TT1]|uniref:MFS transporter n=1 Tax=unclassified Saccharothrix TaxID=2593673 RepID=UPI00345C408A